MVSLPNKSVGATSQTLAQWVGEVERLTRPKRLVWCDGSPAERNRLLSEAMAAKVLLPLDQRRRPGCYLHRSNPNDVARTEDATFICTPSKEEAGPTNNWAEPKQTYEKLAGWLEGSMAGGPMYVVPYVLGPLGSPFAKVGVEITDSIYVALSMGIMTRMGAPALDVLGSASDFNRGLHCTLGCDPARRLICHFPQDNVIWSVGSNYGGNALLSKKCFALRIASHMARDEGWMAEHMLIVGVQNPQGETTYVAAAFPSACGKTNLAMLTPPPAFHGWRVFTVGDDIAWMRVGADGRLWAVNPEFGYFGVAPGTNAHSNPNAMRMLEHDTIFTNVALTPAGDVWWEGIGVDPPPGTVDWRGRPWRASSGTKAAHPNSRFTTPMTNNPALSPHADDPQGVPISAIIFGGRRASTVPLVLEAFDWNHGVYLGATMGSETTAAATGKVGVVRRDPMAMLPFCGYDMGRYFGHWLAMGRKIPRPPKIFMVNWFRKGADGSFLWPGYGENMRVLDWIIRRVNDGARADQTPVGLVPRAAEMALDGLDITDDHLKRATAIDAQEWEIELEGQQRFLARLGATVPDEIMQQLARVRRAFNHR
jgi:phosphoenolpyruvate carboxykinase (GTP)